MAIVCFSSCIFLIGWTKPPFFNLRCESFGQDYIDVRGKMQCIVLYKGKVKLIIVCHFLTDLIPSQEIKFPKRSVAPAFGKNRPEQNLQGQQNPPSRQQQHPAKTTTQIQLSTAMNYLHLRGEKHTQPWLAGLFVSEHWERCVPMWSLCEEFTSVHLHSKWKGGGGNLSNVQPWLCILSS